MRRLILAFALLLAMNPMAAAAPTCMDNHANTMRCGTPGAMPVGWVPSPQILWDHDISRPAETGLSGLVKVVLGLALFFAMIALMPEFDGRHARDWGRQEDDDADDA